MFGERTLLKCLLMIFVSASSHAQFSGVPVDELCRRVACSQGKTCRVYKRCDFPSDSCEPRPVCVSSVPEGVDDVCHRNLYHNSVLILYGANVIPSTLTDYKCRPWETFGRCPAGSVCAPDDAGFGTCCYGIIEGLCADTTPLFRYSFAHSDRLYLVSSYPYNDPDFAQDICITTGGYLAEIDNLDEYRAVQTNLQPIPGIGAVLLGARDELVDGTWVFTRTGEPVTSLYWGADETGLDPNKNCLVLEGPDFDMHDAECFNTARDFYFLCEIPWYSQS